MPGSVAGLLSCWYQWLGNLNSDIWNLVLGCLMWIVWLERNRRSFEDNEKTLDELKVLCQRSLFEWSCCWGFTDCSTLFEFMASLSLVSWFLFFVVLFVLLFLLVHHHEQLVLFLFFSFIIDFCLPIKKKKRLYAFIIWLYPHAEQLYSSNSIKPFPLSDNQYSWFMFLHFILLDVALCLVKEFDCHVSDRTAELMFEKYKVPALFLAKNAVCF